MKSPIQSIWSQVVEHARREEEVRKSCREMSESLWVQSVIVDVEDGDMAELTREVNNCDVIAMNF